VYGTIRWRRISLISFAKKIALLAPIPNGGVAMAAVPSPGGFSTSEKRIEDL
jgi:hypothetical protein